jgi:CubicO group peptidase (beta-lactamase class C family)
MMFRQMRTAISSALLAMLVVGAPAAAEPLPIVAPERVGMSGAHLDQITKVFKAEIARNQLPGAVIGVARKGQLVYFESLGYRDPAARDAMPANALFSIASMTKPMVSVAIMMLRDEGRLSLSDPVGKYLPALGDMRVGVVKGGKVETVAAVRQPTVLDLLRHTSGFTYGSLGDTPVHKLWLPTSGLSSLALSAPEFVRALARAPLLYQPGTVWDYGLSVDVLGLIVEAVSGKPLGAFLQEHLWLPLGMVDTAFAVPAAKESRYARAFANDPQSGRPQFVLHADGRPLKFDCGGGCAVSTAPDYLRFAQMLANGGILDGKRIIATKTLATMTSDRLGADVRGRTTNPILPQGYGFGLGFAVRTQTASAALAGTDGDYYWNGGYGTYFSVDPKEELITVLMTAAPGEIRARNAPLLRNLVLQSIRE